MSKLYFAYGSNLCTADWNEWCDRHGYDGSGLTPVEPAMLPDHELHFSHYSSTRGGGALNVLPSVGRVVEGVVMEADEEAWEALNAKEGAPTCYEAVEMTVLDANGHPMSAIVYRLREDRVRDFVRPTDAYVEAVHEGLEYFGLPTDALMAAANDQVIPAFTNAVFVYGTLMRGECRFHSLSDFEIEASLMGAIAGDLVDLGSYPGLLPHDGASAAMGTVDGDFIRVKDIVGALHCLDAIEGFEGYEPQSLYVRRLTQVDVGGRLRWAWTYEYNLAVTDDYQLIESGSWRTHTEVASHFMARLVDDHAGKLSERALLRKLRRLHPFDAECPTFPKVLDQLADAIRSNLISERRLAQASGCWLAAT